MGENGRDLELVKQIEMEQRAWDRIFVTTDTHLGHRNIVKYCGRPEGFEGRILAGTAGLALTEKDLYIHCGDVAFAHGGEWNDRLTKAANKAHKILVRGNHDRKPTFHLNHGWDMVVQELVINTVGGLKIKFTHIPPDNPIPDNIDIHFFGHMHNSVGRIWEAKKRLLAQEFYGYVPWEFGRMLGVELPIAEGAGDLIRTADPHRTLENPLGLNIVAAPEVMVDVIG